MYKMTTHLLTLLLLSTSAFANAQVAEKLSDSPEQVVTTDNTWKRAEETFRNAQNAEDSGDLKKAKDLYSSTIEILRGLQLIDASYKKEFIETRIRTCKLSINVLERTEQNTRSPATVIVHEPKVDNVRPTIRTPPPARDAQRPAVRSGSIIEQIEQMEKEIIALNEENAALRAELSNVRHVAADAERVKTLEAEISKKNAEVEAVRANVTFLEARWIKTHENQINAQTEAKNAKLEAELKIKDAEQKAEATIAKALKDKEVEFAKKESEISARFAEEKKVIESKVQAATTQGIQALENAKNAAKAELDKLRADGQKELADLKIKNEADLTAVRDNFKQSLNESQTAFSNLKKQHDELAGKVNQEKNIITANFQAEKQALLEKINALNEASKKVEADFKHNLETIVANARAEEQKNWVNKLTATEENANRIKEESKKALEESVSKTNAQIQEKVQAFELERKELVSKLTALQTAFDETKKALEQEKTQLATRLAEVQGKFDASKGDYEALLKKEVESINKVANDKIEELSKTFTKEREMYATEISNLKTGSAPLTQKIQNLETTISKLNQDLTQQTQRYSALQIEKNKEKEMSNNVTKELTTKIKSLEELLNNLGSKQETTIKKLNADLEALKHEKESLSAMVLKFRRENVSPEEYERKQKALENYMRENSELKKELFKYKPAGAQ